MYSFGKNGPLVCAAVPPLLPTNFQMVEMSKQYDPAQRGAVEMN